MLTCSRFRWHIFRTCLVIKLSVTDIAEAIASYNFHFIHVYRGKGITCSCIALSSTLGHVSSRKYDFPSIPILFSYYTLLRLYLVSFCLRVRSL